MIGAPPRAVLEDWLREAYFSASYDISSSGIAELSLAEVRTLAELPLEVLDGLTLRDSPSRGHGDLRCVIADRFGNGDASRVAVANGSTEALLLVLRALLRSGDDVVVIAPYYHALGNVPRAMGCTVRQWPLRWARGYQPDLDELATLITPRTRAVIVNFPHNPTGATVTPDEQLELLGILDRVGAYLVWDAALAELTYDGARPLEDPSRVYERAISIGTLSKAYGLPGLRFGWCVAPPDLLETFVSTRDYTTLSSSPLIELIAEHVLRSADTFVLRHRAIAHRNRALVLDWLAAEALDGHLEWVTPRGGVTVFPRINGVGDTWQLCTTLLERHSTLVVPGRCFGRPAHVRLGFGCASTTLEAGLANLTDILRSAPARPRRAAAPVELKGGSGCRV